jgi:hypothetical protein
MMCTPTGGAADAFLDRETEGAHASGQHRRRPQLFEGQLGGADAARVAAR